MSSALVLLQINRNTKPQQASTNYKEAFSLFDKRGTGRVPADALGDLLRACGQNPTLAEISDLEKNVGKECKSLYNFLGNAENKVVAQNSI